MKTVKVTLILLTAAAIIIFMKAGRALDLRRALPFCDGDPSAPALGRPSESPSPRSPKKT
jgi:hypothetical protein